MKVELLKNDYAKTDAVIFDRGDEVLLQLQAFAELQGVATCDPDERRLHSHAVLADADARAYGGHLLEAHADPTLELIET